MILNMTKPNEVPVEEIPEVAAFVEVQARYEKYKEDNPEFFKWLEELSEEYNEKLSVASKIVRARSVSCGPFDRFQTSTTYNAEEMFQILGQNKFLEMGGKEVLQKIRTVDKVRVERYIQSGDIDAESAAVIKKVSPRYRSIEEVKVP